MAKQKGIIKLRGTLGDISFYKTQDGHMAREKGEIDKSRIENDPRFRRTRENGSEFGRAGKTGKLLRDSLRILILNASDSRVVSRLLKEIMAVIKTDLINPRGERTVINGSLNLLQGFEFNNDAVLSQTFYAPYSKAFDRTTGVVTMNVEAFTPMVHVKAPAGTTHFKIVSGSALIDFKNNSFEMAQNSTDYIVWNGTEQAAMDIGHTLTANSDLPLFTVLGVNFYQIVNGVNYPLNNGSFNALTLVQVDQV
ncbi:hypothetical protein [Zhouia amylolytica]|uniref:Uncharacterized protein n=1 Tax=Zhouia amylolytica AD3 TaxID=1286632 RepID=W2UKM6_9FLAO|nr:hypothetical protein [Zhouia amylolytica]ETN94001.1 hypothetical protein P278_28050 [Zhouia amylolytica AD3]